MNSSKIILLIHNQQQPKIIDYFTKQHIINSNYI